MFCKLNLIATLAFFSKLLNYIYYLIFDFFLILIKFLILFTLYLFLALIT